LAWLRSASPPNELSLQQQHTAASKQQQQQLCQHQQQATSRPARSTMQRNPSAGIAATAHAFIFLAGAVAAFACPMQQQPSPSNSPSDYSGCRCVSLQTTQPLPGT
jgi:hypothetical protein